MDIAKGHRDSSAFPRTFLSSPINTIVASTEFTYHLSRHDLLEAYHTLNLRLITLSNGVEGAVVDYQRATMQMEALAPLKSNAPMLIEALKRDIRGALVNPLPATSHSATYPYNLSSIYQDSDFMSQSQVDLTPDDVQRATEVVMLCHYSLQVVSIIFHSSVLQELVEGTSNHTQMAVGLQGDRQSKTLPHFSSLFFRFGHQHRSHHRIAARRAHSSFGCSRFNGYQRQCYRRSI